MLDISNTRDGRTGSYVKRVFYEKKYAGELRLFGIGDLLLSRHKKAYEEMEERTRKIRKKLCVIQIVRWTLFDIFSGALPYLYIAIVSEGSSIGKAAYIAMIPALVSLSWRITEVVEIYTILIKESAFVTNLREFLSYTPKKMSVSLLRQKSLMILK